MSKPKYRDYDVVEILEELETIKDVDNKIEWLRDNFSDHQPLQYVIRFNYDKNIVSRLPEGEPPFTKGETDGPTPASLWAYLRVFPVFVQSAQSAPMKMNQIEKSFIEMLEAIEPKEAEVVCLAKDRKLGSKYNITIDMFEKAFNMGMIPAEMPEITPPSPEEQADRLLTLAKQFRDESKTLNAKAREYEKEAKELLANAAE